MNPPSLRKPRTLWTPADSWEGAGKEAPPAPTLAGVTTQSPGLTRSFSGAHDTLNIFY